MKKIIYILILFVCLKLISFKVALAQPYTVYQPNQYESSNLGSVDERILFILDFSNSMSENVGKDSKVHLMLNTMSEILPYVNKKAWVGLRVYGHKMGFTAYDACKASSLLVPITQASAEQIEAKLGKTNPRGMTPITYSLNKAVTSDFSGFSGKKHIILLTDGGENCDESPCVWAMEFIKLRQDVKIDVIAFNINNEDDLDQLECTALVTTGKFYTAENSAQLVDSLKKSLNTRKNVEAKIIENP